MHSPSPSDSSPQTGATPSPDRAQTPDATIGFIGGGNMASAIVGGLLRQGLPADRIEIVEPWDAARARLLADFGITARAAPDAALARCDVVVWAVKPQTFRDAAGQARAHCIQALQLSVAAGIRSDTIAGWLGTERVVRSMPNTPALVGKGITGLFARDAVTPADRALVERIVASTGEHVWLQRETQLDAVTALSGSGPAYVFYFIEAMVQAGTGMGLLPEDARRLAVSTFAGAAALAGASTEPPEVLRQQVTSKGGTTHAAIVAMESAGMQAAFVQAMRAAQQRAQELGDEFGRA